MQIQGGDDGHSGANQPAYGLQHMSLPVVQVVCHHGTVQMQQHTVNLARPLNPFEEMSTKIIKGLATHRATGNGTAKDRPNEFEAVFLGRIHERGLDGIRAPEAARDIIAMRNPLLGKLLHRGGDIRKGIGFVRKGPGYDAHVLALSAEGVCEAVEVTCGLSPHTSATSS